MALMAAMAVYQVVTESMGGTKEVVPAQVGVAMVAAMEVVVMVAQVASMVLAPSEVAAVPTEAECPGTRQ